MKISNYLNDEEKVILGPKQNRIKKIYKMWVSLMFNQSKIKFSWGKIVCSIIWMLFLNLLMKFW